MGRERQDAASCLGSTNVHRTPSKPPGKIRTRAESDSEHGAQGRVGGRERQRVGDQGGGNTEWAPEKVCIAGR